MRPIHRDIGDIIDRVKARLPDVKVWQHWVPNAAVDDDGVWFFSLPETDKTIQLEFSFGRCPFFVEHDDMRSTAEAQTATSIEEAVEMVAVYLFGVPRDRRA